MADSERKHGRTRFYLIDEGFKPSTDDLKKEKIPDSLRKVMMRSNDLASFQERYPFCFGRMFDIKGSALSPKGLEELAIAMIQAEDHKEHTELPAGYTFLGQFIDHDLSFDSLRTILPEEGEVRDPRTILSNRSPSLDLDSLYGYYPFSDDEHKFDKRLYEADGVRMKIGCTSKVTKPLVPKCFPFDLRRDNKVAVIGDERNDENLPLAQTTLAFLKFHNQVVELLKTAKPELAGHPAELFKQAREMVVKHYQWIILHDFLPEITDKLILRSVIESVENDGSGPTWLAGKKEIFMPVEFSGAAFRLGHSLLQDAYEWNIYFESGQPAPIRIATFADLFVQTGSNSSRNPVGLGFSTLPGHWMIDWRRFYDFTRYGISIHPKFNRSRKIDPFIGHIMKFLPEFINDKPNPDISRNLAARNLIRGNFLELPTGQDVAKLLVQQNRLKEEDLLTDEQILDGAHKEVLIKHGFNKDTPLWYYILKEAEMLGEKGKRLGPVGSCIVADTFVELIRQSEISILREKWRPTANNPQIPVPKRSAKEFEMADLLVFAHESKLELLNPTEAENVPECSC